MFRDSLACELAVAAYALSIGYGVGPCICSDAACSCELHRTLANARHETEFRARHLRCQLNHHVTALRRVRELQSSIVPDNCASQI